VRSTTVGTYQDAWHTSLFIFTAGPNPNVVKAPKTILLRGKQTTGWYIQSICEDRKMCVRVWTHNRGWLYIRMQAVAILRFWDLIFHVIFSLFISWSVDRMHYVCTVYPVAKCGVCQFGGQSEISLICGNSQQVGGQSVIWLSSLPVYRLDDRV